MKKIAAIFVLTLCSVSANAQLQSGTVLTSNRKALNESNYTINSTVEGTVIVELAVNPKGDVTSAKVISEGTTITSTPQVMKAQNAGKKLKFTPGTHFAEFEHVRVKYTYKKS